MSFTLEGAIRHQRGPASGGVPLMHRGANRLATVLSITAVATERCHQDRAARLLLHDALHHDLVEVRPMIPAVPSGTRHNLFLRLLVAVVAPIAVNTRAIARGQAGRKAQALGSGRGHEAVECGDLLGMVSGRLVPIRPCDYHGILVYQSVSGSICKRTMSLREKKIGWRGGWRRK
jgi:hypothetical protein